MSGRDGKMMGAFRHDGGGRGGLCNATDILIVAKSTIRVTQFP